MSKTRREASRFLVIGVTAVVIDFAIYRLGLWLGVPVGPAKATSFLAGTLFAYFANRHWTFEAGGRRADWREIGRFVVTYGISLLVNVGVNGAILRLLGHKELTIWTAFVIATGISATMNFIGMKFFVFRAAITEAQAGRDRGLIE